MLKIGAYDLPVHQERHVRVGRAATLEPSCRLPLPVYVQTITPAVGGGSLEEARGSDHLTRDGVVLKGEHDIFGKSFNSDAMADPRGRPERMVRRDVERQQLVRVLVVGQQLVGLLVVRAAAGRVSWSGSSWSGSSWSAVQLVGLLVVRLQLVGLVLVRQQLVDGRLELDRRLRRVRPAE